MPEFTRESKFTQPCPIFILPGVMCDYCGAAKVGILFGPYVPVVATRPHLPIAVSDNWFAFLIGSRPVPRSRISLKQVDVLGVRVTPRCASDRVAARPVGPAADASVPYARLDVQEMRSSSGLATFSLHRAASHGKYCAWAQAELMSHHCSCSGVFGPSETIDSLLLRSFRSRHSRFLSLTVVRSHLHVQLAHDRGYG